MALAFEMDQLTVRVIRMPRERVLGFGILLLERMVPHFLRFQMDEGVVGGSVLKAALAKAWNVLERDDPGRFREITAKDCEALAPDTEKFRSAFTSAALNAANGAANVLDYLDVGDTDLIVETATLMRDTIFLFVSNESSERNGDPLQSALMQSELRREKGDLDLVERTPLGDPMALYRAVLARSMEAVDDIKLLQLTS
jgi:hypothetical protein